MADIDAGPKTEEEEEAKAKRVFWIRFALWCLFACILPVCFIGWRYDIFGNSATMKLSGWGLIAVIIAAVFGFSVFKYIKAAFKAEYSMLWQCISGFFKIVFPILLVAVALNTVKDSIDKLVQALSATAAFEAVAIPLNPMPKWVFDKTKGAMQSPIDYFFKKRDEAENAKKGGNI